MKLVSAEQIYQRVTYPQMVEALREGFRADIVTPLRHHHTIAKKEGEDGVLLLMPAWQNLENADSKGSFSGIKIVTVTPDNHKRNKSSVMAVYLLNDGESGEPLALIDGQMLTFMRTSCASALAADYLARADATSLLMVGAGDLAPHLIRAHCAVRNYDTITIWNRNHDKAKALADELSTDDTLSGKSIKACDDLDAAIAAADTISCATLSREPLVKGRLLREGQHVDLVGAFTPEMRESDDDCLRRATVFVDTEGAVVEAGDLARPIAEGKFSADAIAGDLQALCRGQNGGRGGDAEITLFKSAGTAIEDLAGAILIHQQTQTA